MEQDQKKTANQQSQEQIDDDADTIFAETGHIRDRDEIMLTGNRVVQGGSSADIDDEWDPSDGDRLSGESDQSSEAVDAQFKEVGRISEDIRDTRDHHQATLAKPIGGEDDYENLSDDDLMKHADVLGIPDRGNVPRMKLIGLIREQERLGL